jgi:hypothetical protein
MKKKLRKLRAKVNLDYDINKAAKREMEDDHLTDTERKELVDRAIAAGIIESSGDLTTDYLSVIF